MKSQAYSQVNLDELVNYPLSLVSYSLGTADGYMAISAKTDTSKWMKFLMKYVNDAPLPNDTNTMLIKDGNALFHGMTYISTKSQLICQRMLDSMPNSVNLVFSTDR